MEKTNYLDFVETKPFIDGLNIEIRFNRNLEIYSETNIIYLDKYLTKFSTTKPNLFLIDNKNIRKLINYKDNISYIPYYRKI